MSVFITTAVEKLMNHFGYSQDGFIWSYDLPRRIHDRRVAIADLRRKRAYAEEILEVLNKPEEEFNKIPTKLWFIKEDIKYEFVGLHADSFMENPKAHKDFFSDTIEAIDSLLRDLNV